jgi:hypothetical protein
VAKITTEFVDGWPVMAPLGTKEEALLEQQLAPAERVLGQVIALHGQALVATDRRLLVVKAGIMSGRTFGGTASGFDYADVRDIELHTYTVQGELEIVVPGLPYLGGVVETRVPITSLPHILLFAKAELATYEAMAAKVREMVAASRVDTGAPAESAPQPDALDRLRRLGELRDAGVVTVDEFEAAKAQLLARV